VRGMVPWRHDGSHAAVVPICYMGDAMARKTTRVLVSRELADEAMRALGAKSRSEAARVAVLILLGREQPNHLAGQAARKDRDRRAKKKN